MSTERALGRGTGRARLTIGINAIEGPFQRLRLGRLRTRRHRQKPFNHLQGAHVEHIGARDMDVAVRQGKRQHLAAQGHVRRHAQGQGRVDFDLVHVEQAHAIGVGREFDIFHTAHGALALALALAGLKPDNAALAQDYFPWRFDVKLEHGVDR